MLPELSYMDFPGGPAASYKDYPAAHVKLIRMYRQEGLAVFGAFFLITDYALAD